MICKKTTNTVLLNELKQIQYNMKNVTKYSNCTPFANKTLNGYVCAFCNESFSEPQELRNHTQTIHKNVELDCKIWKDRHSISVKVDISDLACTICNTNVDILSSLKKHLIKEHDIKFYPNVEDYFIEFKLVSSSDTLICALCHSPFETFKMLLQHMNGHYRNFVCETCGVGFLNKLKLCIHKKTHETGTFKCDSCEKVFVTKRKKEYHEKMVHKSKKCLRKCPHCDLNFPTYNQRNSHMLTEHNTAAALYKCNICDKSYKMKWTLTCHIKKVHLMERNYVCTVCGKDFFSNDALEHHFIKHTGQRIHRCEFCQKAYARKNTLREHLKIHNNDRRFKCGVCGLAFVQKCSMKSHMLSNHGITFAECEKNDLK